MVFSNDLFISKNLDNPDKILNMLKNAECCQGVYIVCFNLESRNLLEILRCTKTPEPYNKKSNLIALALCSNKEEAKERCVYIFTKYLAEHGNFDLFRKNARQFLSFPTN